MSIPTKHNFNPKQFFETLKKINPNCSCFEKDNKSSSHELQSGLTSVFVFIGIPHTQFNTFCLGG